MKNQNSSYELFCLKVNLQVLKQLVFVETNSSI